MLLLLSAACRKLTVCLWKPDIPVGASLIPLSVQYVVCQKYSQECGQAHSHHRRFLCYYKLFHESDLNNELLWHL